MSNLNITYKNITGKRIIEHLRVELTTPQHILAIRAINDIGNGAPRRLSNFTPVNLTTFW